MTLLVKSVVKMQVSLKTYPKHGNKQTSFKSRKENQTQTGSERD